MFDAERPIIVLVGHSGVGKSTLGPLLANAFGYTFFDIDQEIADLPNVRRRDADLRREIISELSLLNGVVLAAGCQDFCDQIMTQDVKRRVFSVWITANTDGRSGRTVQIYTEFYWLSTIERDRLFGFADLTVKLGSLEISEASELLIHSVKTALSRQSRQA